MLNNTFVEPYGITFGTATNPGGNFTIPAGQYFRGVFHLYGPSTGTNTSVCTITNTTLSVLCVSLGSEWVTPANVFLTATQEVILGPGNYTIATPQGFNTNNTVVGVYGALFRY